MKYLSSILRLSYIFTIGLSVLALGWAAFFVQRNFDQALTKTSEVHLLGLRVAQDTLNTRLWDRVTVGIADKQSGESISSLPLQDPFDPDRL